MFPIGFSILGSCWPIVEVASSINHGSRPRHTQQYKHVFRIPIVKASHIFNVLYFRAHCNLFRMECIERHTQVSISKTVLAFSYFYSGVSATYDLEISTSDS
jgi:glycogen synthase